MGYLDSGRFMYCKKTNLIADRFLKIKEILKELIIYGYKGDWEWASQEGTKTSRWASIKSVNTLIKRIQTQQGIQRCHDYESSCESWYQITHGKSLSQRTWVFRFIPKRTQVLHTLPM